MAATSPNPPSAFNGGVSMPDFVARLNILGIRPDGGRIEIEFAVGTPYEEEPNQWRCSVSLSPLYKRLADAAGGDAMQSLCLALSLGLDLLGKFNEDGGKLLNDDGKDFPLDSYAFGYALRER